MAGDRDALVMSMAAPDPASGSALHKQISDGIRYAIATGRARPGERLPTLDGAAKKWGVNLHTVRRAYGTLADEGLLHMRPRLGAHVRRTSRFAPSKALPLAAFLDAVISEAERAYGLTRDDLAGMIRHQRQTAKQRGVVQVLECTLDQAEHHGAELNNAFALSAGPVCLSDQREPRPGPILATYFHLPEVLARWPGRQNDIIFMAVEPSEEVAGLIRMAVGKVKAIVLHEAMAMRGSMMEEQLRALPGLADVPVKVVGATAPTPELDRVPMDEPGVVHLYAPRQWADLPNKQKADQHRLELPYQITGTEMDRLAHLFG